MDEHGTYGPSDLDEISHAVVSSDGFTIAYSDDNESSYIVSIAKAPKLGGILPWGGKIDGMHLVALRMRGSNFFDLYSAQFLHFNYLQEKLGLEEAAAKTIADLLNGVRERIRNGKA